MKRHAAFIMAVLAVSPAGAASESPAPTHQRWSEAPSELPAWMLSRRRRHISPRRGVYNGAIQGVPALARDLNAVAVGHAMAYEDLVSGRAGRLETETYSRIVDVLRSPPAFMPDEGLIAPRFGRMFGVLEQVFEWGHVLHAQTFDVLASPDLSEADKEREIDALWENYVLKAPFTVTALPLNMAYMDSGPVSGAFRRRFPRVNGLFWGYHWLQGAAYDVLYGHAPSQQRAAYSLIGERYRMIELYRTDRSFMPMFAELSPRFALRFPGVANAFDNLHMLHDMVNDILASEGLTPREREKMILEAIWMVSPDAHRGERPASASSAGGLHDHRHPVGMPGMGLMKGGDEDVMYMDGMGWMSMADCHHCSMPLPEADAAWTAPAVSADGWSMRVRCALCARDMAAETKGRALLHLPTEDRRRPLLVTSDERGELTGDNPAAVFLEEEAGHRSCHRWSRVFSSSAAFESFRAQNPAFKDARALSLSEWAVMTGRRPDTYVKPVLPRNATGGRP